MGQPPRAPVAGTQRASGTPGGKISVGPRRPASAVWCFRSHARCTGLSWRQLATTAAPVSVTIFGSNFPARIPSGSAAAPIDSRGHWRGNTRDLILRTVGVRITCIVVVLGRVRSCFRAGLGFRLLLVLLRMSSAEHSPANLTPQQDGGSQDAPDGPAGKF